MAQSRRKRIFISHVATETDFAQYLQRRLAGDFLGSFDTFVSSDQTSIGAGARWLDEVEDALRNSDLLLVLCSKESVSRPWVNFEAGAVWLTGVPVVPVCHSGMTPSDLPVPLSFLQAIRAREPDDLRKLYDRIAATVGLQVPSTDFREAADAFGLIESRHASSRESMKRIKTPRVLCAASAQYAEPKFGFGRDVAVLEREFPGRVLVERALTRMRLLQLLTSQRFDIVHLVLPVEERTGNMVFSPFDLEGSTNAPRSAEKLSPKGLADLLVESGTSLVVLATCDALLLAVEVNHVTNIAASHHSITADSAAEWEACFYGLLSTGMPLSKAFELTKSQSDAPIKCILRYDVVFGLESDRRRQDNP